MIRLFSKNETDFSHNETVLNPIKCKVKESANGSFELEYESLQDSRIENGMVIVAPTPRGNQKFRIYQSKHTLRKTMAKARHIFYDLNANWLEDTRAVATNGSGALNVILGGTLYPHRFTSQSTVTNTATSYFVRKNPVQAILGDGGLIERWGGFIWRDNELVKHIPYGRDLGYDVRYGKNLQGISVETDDTEVVTRVMPTWVVDNVVQTLPEKYIDSPLIGEWEYPRVSEYRISVPENTTDIQSFIRNEVAKAFNDGLDKPKVSYTFDFVVLKDLPEYKDFVWVEELDLYDIVNVQVPKMNVYVESMVLSYEYDCIRERIIKASIGDARNSMTEQISRSISKVEDKIDVKASELLQKQKEATDKLSGVTGGNIVINQTPEGTPYEILIMDTNDVKTAKNVVRLNQQGMGFSDTGILGPYGVAITIDGHVVADYIDTGVLAAEIIKGGVFADLKGKFFLNLETGAFNLGNKLTYDPATGIFKLDGSLVVNAINGTTLKINGQNIILNGSTTVANDFKVQGNSIMGTLDAQEINVVRLNADNLNRGTVGTSISNDSGHMMDGYRSAKMQGSLNTIDGNSQVFYFDYARNNLMVQGRLSSTINSNFHEFQLNGCYVSGYGQNAMLRVTSTGARVEGTGNFEVVRPNLVGDVFLRGRALSLGTDGNVKWS